MSATLLVHPAKRVLNPEYPVLVRELAALLRIQPSMAYELRKRYPHVDTAAELVAEFRGEARAKFGSVPRIDQATAPRGMSEFA